MKHLDAEGHSSGYLYQKAKNNLFMKRPLVNKRWNVTPGDNQIEATLIMDLGVHPIVARMLAQRGLTTPELADEFLNPALERLHDPLLLPDAEIACQRIKTALYNKEKILIYGDYDGDGVTSAALWTRLLRSLGGDVDVFVPHRKRDGYDMRAPAIEKAKADGVNLIITTDCGIQRIDEVEAARAAGIDVIITDHHTPNANGSLPDAIAVVNPHRKDSIYPFPNLAGVGVAFKMGAALTTFLGHRVEAFYRGFLDLAAIGTITDCMPLLGENRILVKNGLDALMNTKKPGLRCLIAEAGHAEKVLDARAVSHGIGPRLNAASRVDETQIALDLLMTKDDTEGYRLARRLNELNNQRRDDQDKVFEEALAQVAQQDVTEARCLVLSGNGWPAGLAGLVASKMVERFNRPCVVIAMDERSGKGKGSARSIQAFNIYNAIDACRDLLDEYGGHAHAAGLSLGSEQVTDFAAQMNRLAGSLLSEEDFVPSLEVTKQVDPSEIVPELLEQLEAMAPFGHANREPLFSSLSVPVVDVARMGKEQNHLRLKFQADGLNGRDVVDAPWFFRGDLAEVFSPGSTLDICYRPQFNYWKERRSIQFMIEDIRPPEW